MRAYSFTNFMLSSIQQGIQPAHALVDMFVKYDTESAQRAVLLDWATNHRTMICLNGGNAAELRSIYERIQEIASLLELPFQKFHEDEQSLDGSMTSVAIIVPTHIYEGAAEIRQERAQYRDELITARGWGSTEVQLMELLNSYGLAK